MNRLLPAALLFCAAAFLANPAWSFQGFGLFEQIQHSIECARKPGSDYLTCSNKVVSQDDDDTTPVVEPVTEPTTPPLSNFKPEYDYYNREIQDLAGVIDMPGCDNPTKNYIGFAMDIDQDGDQDMLYGFECVDWNQTKTQAQAEENPHLYYDDSLQWIADSYLAVMINHNGVYRNDQSVFGGEYPVIDNMLKLSSAKRPRDHNGDGYPDVVLVHHWDNTRHNYLNNRVFGLDITSQALTTGSTVILSNSQGKYQTHILPAGHEGQSPNFYTDELGDIYVWSYSSHNRAEQYVVDRFHENSLGMEWRPFAGKVIGNNITDVTDTYFQIFENLGDNQQYCYSFMGTELSECGTRLDVYSDNVAININGRVYQNVISNNRPHIGKINRKVAFWDTIPEMQECQAMPNRNDVEWDALLRCQIDYLTNNTLNIPVMSVFAMHSQDGLYVENQGTTEVIYRVYIRDIPQSILDSDASINPNTLKDYQIYVQSFINLGDNWYILGGGWGLDVATQDDRQIAIVNIAGSQLDRGIHPRDPEVDEYFNWISENDPSSGWDVGGSLMYYTNHSTGIYETIEAGYCPDILDKVEPEDCIDETWLTQNWVDRGQTRETEYAQSVGFSIQADVIQQIPGLTNQPMGFNPQRTFLVDYDTDGDLDLLLTTYNTECSGLCMFENLGNYEYEMVDTGFWGFANDDYFDWMASKCQGPQRPEDGQSNNSLCDLNTGGSRKQFFDTLSGYTRMTDIDGDGLHDIYKIHDDKITIIYGE